MPETISADPLARLAERQSWITPEAERSVQRFVKDAFKPFGANAQKVRDALHGTWLHEPLHAVLTDVPVGSWTAAIAFDTVGSLTSSSKLDAAADASVLLGLAGAVGAAITGMNDWAEINDAAPRRIGAVHALLNVGATGFFVASSLLRRKDATRSRARGLAVLGYLLVSASAHLGGNLVYEHGVGVSRENISRESDQGSLGVR